MKTGHAGEGDEGVFLPARAVHFVGLGGIGVSALARLALHAGKRVSGSDRAESRLTRELAAEGAAVYVGHDASHLPADADVLVYSVAADESNPEIAEARRRELPVLTYAQALGEISLGKHTVAIAGTHGKTTTTAMVAKILQDAGRSPTVIVGSLLAEGGSNFVPGDSDLFVVEACEYRRSFLEITPDIAVVTNVESDHLDCYQDLGEIQEAFARFVSRTREEGAVVANLCQESVGTVVQATLRDVVDYSTFELGVDLLVPGRHNRENARAALAVAALLGVDEDEARKSLATFRGTWRRFERRGEVAGAPVFDDYAHHPAEIVATVQGAREAFPGREVVAVFQPHLYSRTKLLLEDFGRAFGGVSKVILLPIYAAREPADPSVSSADLAAKIEAAGQLVELAESLDDAAAKARLAASPEAVVVVMGAGDVSGVADRLVAAK